MKQRVSKAKTVKVEVGYLRDACKSWAGLIKEIQISVI